MCVTAPPTRPFDDGLVTEHYDVIIVGSGAEHARPHAARPASGYCCSNGRLPAPRDGQLESRRRSWTGSTFPPIPGTTPTASRSSRRLRPEDFGELKHADGVSPAWPVSYDDFEPWYTRAEWLYQVHGVRGEDPTEGHYSRQYAWPPVSHEARIQEISDAWPPAATIPSTRRAASSSTRPTVPRASASAACGATVIRAWSTPGPTPTSSRCVRCVDQPNVTLLVNAGGEQRRDTAPVALGPAPRAWPTVRGRSAATTCPQQQGRRSAR